MSDYTENGLGPISTSVDFPFHFEVYRCVFKMNLLACTIVFVGRCNIVPGHSCAVKVNLLLTKIKAEYQQPKSVNSAVVCLT